MMNLFTVSNISKQFSNHKALDNVSVQVPKQSIYGLLGPNGAGKTTLIRIINQISTPDTGELFFNGVKLNQTHIHKIGYLPEERGLYKKMKVGDQAIYLAQLKGLNKFEAIARLKVWFEKFGIGSWWNRKVEELSKGMQQKIQFIVTIIHKPELLIFDEPFSGFDPINVNLLKEEILKLRDEGATIIFSTHNMASVEELCDNIALINNSKRILQGSVEEIKNQYKSNTYNLSLKGDRNIHLHLGNEFELLEIANGSDTLNAKIRIKKGNQNDLLNNLLPHYQVLSFSEIIPSMNDIFIQRVAESSKV